MLTITRRSIIFLTLAGGLTGCTNSIIKIPVVSPSVSSTSSSTSTSTAAKFVIANVSVAASGSSSSTLTYKTSVYFNTTKSTGQISTYCNTGTTTAAQTAKACVCQFTWTESNPNSGSSVAIQRSVQTSVSSVQSTVLTCAAPDVYQSEIVDGTQIKLDILPGPSNDSAGSFSVAQYTFTKSTNSVDGSFKDSQGHVFDNVLHYSCYQTFSRGMKILSKSASQTNQVDSKSYKYYFGSQFCVGSTGASATQGCEGLPGAETSAQSFYYNLYIRNTERGGIVKSNSNFICPQVVESIGSNGSIGTQGDPWPSDSNFALSLGPTTDFTVGVEANTKLAGSGDPTGSTSSCYATSSASPTPSSSGTSDSAAFITSCLGFAAKPNSDGTCPSIKDSSGLLRPTLRLRRYVAIYPRIYDSSGKPLSSIPQGLDTIYVLDRPVQVPSSDSSNSNPLKTYTMLGPKPCPYAFFDRTNVTGTGIGYKASSDTNWNGKNIDGTEFPNVDNSGANSCSATFPILNSTQTQLSLSTVNINNYGPYSLKHVYIRPAQPFLPHYEEDTSFQACAPQASPVKDAPLHFSRDPNTGNVSWCTEAYPSQNPNIMNLDPAVTPTATPVVPTGVIAPFTSHVVRNSASSTCTSSAINLNKDPTHWQYPNPSPPGIPAYARHPSNVDWDSRPLVGDYKTADLTCDRTVVSTELTWTRFPLLAPAIDIENSINTDKSYMCLITYDNNSGKAGKATPSDGCCNKSVVSVCTGFGTACKNQTKQGAHLEPDVPCGIPAY